MEYIERFWERSLDIHDVCDEKELVKICIQGMFTEYAVHLENLNLYSFTTLVENARRTNNSVSRQQEDSLRFGKRNASVNSVEGEQPTVNKKSRNDKSRGSTPNLTFPCPMGKVHAILDDWLRNEDIKLPRVERQPTAIEKRDPQYCRYHWTVDHPTKDCRSLKWIF